MTPPANGSSGWWMYHGDLAHTGFVSDSPINSSNAAKLQVFKELQLDGPILSTPAIVDGFIYVGIANSHGAVNSNGGAFYKIELATGTIAATFRWDILASEGDTHGFCGMGSTPAVSGGKVFFIAFNGKLYCLDQQTLSALWITDLRHADPVHNQPAANIRGMDQGNAPVAGWSSPVVIDDRLYVGVGEGENPEAFSFVYCLDTATGNVVWLFCTNPLLEGKDNQPNQLPALVVRGTPPPGFTVINSTPVTMGCSVWGGIAYDATLNRLYCPTGNPSPDGPLPCPGYSNGLLALDAATGDFIGFVQFPPESSYRPSDVDVDVGGAPTLFTDEQERRLVALGCKNGGFMTVDAKTLEIVKLRQLLPYVAGSQQEQFPAIDPHPPVDEQNELNPHVTNDVSNDAQNQNENYTGTYSTPAVHSGLRRLFLGIGGKNYDLQSAGIDGTTTPFLRAMDWGTLEDAWPMDDGNPRRYVNGRPPFYANATESGLSVPAVVNDVVLMATTQIGVYAFAADDGRLLWQDQLGQETGGFNGGYGYCMGPAVWQDYVVAGALVYGRDGGILRIYRLQE
ncbi:MAG TPA: PQQ-binding-like beta-propeller repeat protein [Thermoanaerobaculia bacterium]|nr:PQQ-binding-like beta-propeller repeat protein [Thermoanaerobaculia bacterium]